MRAQYHDASLKHFKLEAWYNAPVYVDSDEITHEVTETKA
jgi:hypothetical protein